MRFSLFVLVTALLAYAPNPDLTALSQATGGRGPVLTLRKLLDGPAANILWGAVSPDGRWLSFVDGDYVVLGVRDTTTGAVREVKRASGNKEFFGIGSFWSPRGDRLAYTWGAGAGKELRSITLDGGQSNLLYRPRPGEELTPFAWSPDGRSVLAETVFGAERSLALVNIADGQVRSLTRTARNIGHASFSPDGRHIAYDLRSPDREEREVFVMAGDGTPLVNLTSGYAANALLGWWPDGSHLIVGGQRQGRTGIWAVPLRAGKPSGDPRLLQRETGRLTPLGFAPDGRFYASVYRPTSDVLIASVDPVTGRTVDALRPLSSGFLPDVARGQATWSPDGQHIAFVVADGVVVQSLMTNATQAYPLPLQQVERPVWFPDGRALAIKAQSTDCEICLFRLDLIGDGKLEPLAERGNYFGLSPDGRTLFYSKPENTVQAIWRRDLATGNERVIDRGPRPAMKVSPDGQSIVAYLGTVNAASLVVVPSSGGPRRPIAAELRNAINTIAWSHDSRHVLFVTRPSPDLSEHYEVWRVSIDGGKPERLGISAAWTKHISVSPDGRRIALSVVTGETELWSMANLLPPPASAR